MEERLVELYRGADEEHQQLIIDMLICSVAFGDAFLQQCQRCIDRGESKAVLDWVIKQWMKKLNEVEQ